jgi:hypothetical protein
MTALHPGRGRTGGEPTSPNRLRAFLAGATQECGARAPAVCQDHDGPDP